MSSCLPVPDAESIRNAIIVATNQAISICLASDDGYDKEGGMLRDLAGQGSAAQLQTTIDCKVGKVVCELLIKLSERACEWCPDSV